LSRGGDVFCKKNIKITPVSILTAPGGHDLKRESVKNDEQSGFPVSMYCIAIMTSCAPSDEFPAAANTKFVEITTARGKGGMADGCEVTYASAQKTVAPSWRETKGGAAIALLSPG